MDLHTRSFDVSKKSHPLDLVEMRRTITALRSQHSDSPLLTSLLNRFFVKVAFLSEVRDARHAEVLRSKFACMLQRVEEISKGGPPAR
jgi:hypothetical protein